MQKSNANPRIIVWAECGQNVGWGHFVRSWSLFEELRNRNYIVEFWVTGTIPEISSELELKIIDFPDRELELEKALSIYETVIIDWFDWNISDFDKKPKTVIACVRDIIPPTISCDIWVNPNISKDDREEKNPKYTHCLSGADYIILRSQFNNLGIRKCQQEIKKILIAFGGTQQKDLLKKIIKLLLNYKINFAKAIFIAPNKNDRDLILSFENESFEVLSNVNNMKDLLIESDFGIISGGTLLYEACVTGLPCLTIALNEEQLEESRKFAVKGATKLIEQTSVLSSKEIYSKIVQFFSHQFRQEMAKKSQSVIDFKGRERVVKFILEKSQIN